MLPVLTAQSAGLTSGPSAAQCNSVALQVEEFKAQMARQAADFLKRQMSEKEARDASIKALYANTARPEYFKQFGTSHR